MNPKYVILMLFSLACTLVSATGCYSSNPGDDLAGGTEFESSKTLLSTAIDQPTSNSTKSSSEWNGSQHTVADPNVIVDHHVAQVQYVTPQSQQPHYQQPPTRILMGVDQYSRQSGDPTWQDRRPIPFEALGQGEFLGPIRQPYEADYRVRINDVIEMTFAISRKMLSEPYRVQVGDELEINDANRPEVSKQQHIVIDDGYISPLEIGQVHVAGKTVTQINRMLIKAYRDAGTREPTITVSIIKNNTALRDLLDAIQGQFNANGSTKEVTVAPDGTIMLPIVGRICVYGLTLDEVAREVNLRYSELIYNLNVTPSLIAIAPKSVFVFGEVGQPGVVQLDGPTTVLGAIASAQGFNQGANRRQVVVLRRDPQWRMIATKLDLAGVAFGKKMMSSDDVWLRPSDIVIVPKQPIQRLAEFIDNYFTRTLFVLIPNQGISLSFDSNDILN